MSSPSYLSASGASNSGGSTTVTVPAPPSIQAGNLLIAVVYNATDQSSPAFVAPKGWRSTGPTVAGTTGTASSAGALTSAVSGAAVFTKTTTGSEPTSYTFTGPSWLSAVVLQYSGVQGVDGAPLMQPVTGQGDVASPTKTATPGDVLLNFWGSWDGSTQTTPAGETLRQATQSAGNTSLYVFEAPPLTGAGATPAYTSTGDYGNGLVGSILLSPGVPPSPDVDGLCVGAATINGLYLGGAPVSKAYLGTAQVFGPVG